MANSLNLGSKQFTWICIFLIIYTLESSSFVEARVRSSGTLEVHLVDGRNLKSRDLIGKMDPYVIIEYRGQVKKSRVAHGEGKNPIWNESFKFNVDYSANPRDTQKITLKIMDKDRYSKDDFVGGATMYVKDVISLGMERGSVRVGPTKYRVVLPNKNYYGEIRVGVSFTRKGR